MFPAGCVVSEAITKQNQDQERIPGFYQDSRVKPECMPFSRVEGNEKVMLFVHGLTGSPADFREYVNPYVEAGYDVFVPLWPGHGSHISLLERLTYKELFIPFEPLMKYLMGRYGEIHVTALSYGAIIGADLVLRHPTRTLSFLAPAFYLTVAKEKSLAWAKRLRMHRFRKRVPKAKLKEDGQPVQRDDFTYDAIALLPALELHDRSEVIRKELATCEIPVFHAHGTKDDTTPHHSNHAFLKGVMANYSYYQVDNGVHVLPLDPACLDMAQAHLQWLEKHR